MLLKSLLLAIIIVAAVAATENLESDDVIVVAEEPETCEVGKKYKVDCNLCACLEPGKLACTRMKCVHKEQKRSVDGDDEADDDDYQPLPVLPEGPCVPGERYKKLCNTCICSKRGVAFCTLKQCFSNNPLHTIVARNAEHWGPVYNFGDPCKPGKVFYSECNECICAKNGRSAICTFKLCLSPSEE